jgi:hypothetical protein
MADVARETLMAGLKSLYITGEFSDLTIECEGKKFAVHRNIIYPRTGLKKKACEGGDASCDCHWHGATVFRRPGTSTCVKLPDELENVERMVKFLYTLDYEVENLEEVEEPPSPSLPPPPPPAREESPEIILSEESPVELVWPEAPVKEEPDVESTRIVDDSDGWYVNGNSSTKSKKKGKKKLPQRDYWESLGSSSRAVSAETDDEVKFEPKAVEEVVETVEDRPIAREAEPSPENLPPLLRPLLIHVQMVHLAQNYAIPDLKKLAEDKLFVLLKADLEWTYVDLCLAIREAYSFAPAPSSEPNVREILTLTSYAHSKDLIRDDNFMDVVRDVGEFAADLLSITVELHAEEVVNRPKEETETTRRCKKCRAKRDMQLMCTRCNDVVIIV